jgi:hypothetical protein
MTKNVEKKVEFCIFMEIIIIPSKEDILPYKNELWWNTTEMTNFKNSAMFELFTFMNRNKICNSKDAIRLMYQT